MTVRLFDHREVRHDCDRISAHIAVNTFNQVNARIHLAQRNHPAVVFVFQCGQLLAPVFHLLIRIQQRHARIVSHVQGSAFSRWLFAKLLIESFAMLSQQVSADIILDCSEERNLQAVRSLKQRRTRTVTLRDFRFLFLAHLVGIFELLEKLVGVFDAIEAEIQIIDVLVAGPQPRRFVWRVRTIRRQRKVRLGDRDGRSFLRHCRLCSRKCSARADDVEAKD